MEEDAVLLRPDTAAILAEFLREKEAAQRAAETEAEDKGVELLVPEDWNASQFWYDPATSVALAREILLLAEDVAGRRGAATVACISCPSTYKALRSLEIPAHTRVVLFEYDQRFAVFGEEFHAYDYNAPLALPAQLLHGVDVLCIDPPFLNKECLSQFAITARALRRTEDAPIILCTGAVQEAAAGELLGARRTQFHVGHAGGRLSNPFACFVTYDPGERLGGLEGGGAGGTPGGGKLWSS